MALPFFSVVIPTYNRPLEIESCLIALSQLDYPHDLYEVIVVDDGSKVSLRSVVDKVENRLSVKLNVKLIEQQNAGPAAARNRGVAEANGDYLVFTDDDCMPDSQWLRQFAIALEKSPTAMVGGRTINALPDNLYSSASQALIDYLYSYYNGATSDVSGGVFFASNNIAMVKSQFLEIGGFDVSFPLAAAEDRNLCDCWQQAGYPMQYVPSATIQHAHALSLRSFWRQHFGYGRGAFCFHQVRANRTMEPIKVEPLKFYSDLLTYPLVERGVRSPLAVSGLFFLSQVATTTGFFWERLMTGQRRARASAL